MFNASTVSSGSDTLLKEENSSMVNWIGQLYSLNDSLKEENVLLLSKLQRKLSNEDQKELILSLNNKIKILEEEIRNSQSKKINESNIFKEIKKSITETKKNDEVYEKQRILIEELKRSNEELLNDMKTLKENQVLQPKKENNDSLLEEILSTLKSISQKPLDSGIPSKDKLESTVQDSVLNSSFELFESRLSEKMKEIKGELEELLLRKDKQWQSELEKLKENNIIMFEAFIDDIIALLDNKIFNNEFASRIASIKAIEDKLAKFNSLKALLKSNFTDHLDKEVLWSFIGKKFFNINYNNN